MKVKIFRILSIILLLLWMSLIFRLSSQPAVESSQLSGGITYRVASIFYPNLSDLPPAQQMEIINSFSFIVRKTAHFMFYFMLGTLAYLSIITYEKIGCVLKPIVALIISVVYAVSDEYHQIFITGRSGEIRDVIIDSCGALLSVIIVFSVFNFSKKFNGANFYKNT